MAKSAGAVQALLEKEIEKVKKIFFDKAVLLNTVYIRFE